MNYTQMTEKQINESVAKALGATICKSSFGTPYLKPDFNVSKLSPGGPVDKFDPCNSWADSGPIIATNKITISAPMKYDDPSDWLAYPSSDSDIFVSHPNPLRASMIVFLMMKEKK